MVREIKVIGCKKLRDCGHKNECCLNCLNYDKCDDIDQCGEEIKHTCFWAKKE